MIFILTIRHIQRGAFRKSPPQISGNFRVAQLAQIPVFGCMKTLITIAAVMTMLTSCAPNAKKDKHQARDTVIKPHIPDTTPVIHRRYEDNRGLIWYQEETK